jgi:hypothetical protein
MMPQWNARFRHLEAKSHKPEIRQAIRQLIRSGEVRAIPAPGDPERVLLITIPRAVLDRVPA